MIAKLGMGNACHILKTTYSEMVSVLIDHTTSLISSVKEGD